MDMDWKIIAMAMALAVVLSATIFVPVSLAAGASGRTPGSGTDSISKGLAGTNTSVSKNQSSKANTTSPSGKIGPQSMGYVPGGGPAGTGLRIEGVGPYQKGWMGGPQNPWIYGPSAYPARMFPYGVPTSYLSAGIHK